MTHTPRRSQLNGLFVILESRNAKHPSGPLHPRFKMHYRTKAQAKAAKEAWETKGQIRFPDDLKAKPKPEARSAPMRRRENRRSGDEILT
jgi:hypothetical protein